MKKTKEITNELATNTNVQKTIFKILLGSILCLSLVYVYMIGSITFNVVARKSLENTSKIMGSNISQLELTYLTSVNDINKAKATTLGYVDTNSNIFAVRNINRVAMR